MNPAESGDVDLHVQHIACVNNAGFVMSFQIRRQRDGRHAGDSGNYPINQSRRVDLSQLEFDGGGLEVGDLVQPRVHAVLGSTREGPMVRYAPNGQTATFNVRGTTLHYSVELA
ncbi:hypothetical protein [Marilutibacter chinensis]|uniref:Uncharacterized protein n=1 Tax=Marilutibacter chinensis TaxID=2912247 RepID=A0ABS9HWK0_9GAMM|nr:hypothetical protein [Lysobacter chinensis]MCF7223274.1 hypothetical protein [Lysobacter chinensis]